MFTFILGILAVLFAIVAPKYLFPDKRRMNGEVKSKQPQRKLVRLISVILGIVFIVLSCFTYVPTGYTGILTTFGKVHDNTLDAGINLKTPWDRVITMDNREQRQSFNLMAFSEDIQEVSVCGSVNLNIDKKTAMNLYREVGTEYINILVVPRVLENVKTVIANYTAEELIANRNMLSEEICTMLYENLSKTGVNIISVAIEDLDFSDVFTDAVEAKQVATQKKQQAQTEQERMTMEEEAAANRAIIAANAEAEKAKIAAQADLEVVKIQAEAALYAGEKEAEMNKRISEALTPELIKYYYIKQWDGKLSIVSTDNTMTLIDMSDINEVAD